MTSSQELGGLRGAALVTGGSGGIGAAVCRTLAERGSHVVVLYGRNEAAARAVVAEVESRGRQAMSCAVQLEESESVGAAVSAAVERFGSIHTVIHAAGPFVPQLYLSAVTPEQYRRQIEREAVAFFNLVHAVLPELRRSRGALVAVTTAATSRFLPKDGLSAGTKASIEALVRIVAAEEGRYGIRANCVGPGVLRDGMVGQLLKSGDVDEETLAATAATIPLRRLGSAHEVAEAACFLASPRAAYISGQILDVDGGYSV